MEQTTIWTIETEINHKIWIGIDELQTLVSIGLVRPNKSIWSGETIFRNGESNEIYIQRIRSIAFLFNIVLSNIDVLHSNFILSVCNSVIKKNKNSYEEENIRKITTCIENFDQKIQETLAINAPKEFIDSCKKALYNNNL